MGAADSEILIRGIAADEEEKVIELYDRNLGIIDRLVFTLSFRDVVKSARSGLGATFVAIIGSKVVGSLSVRPQRHRGKRVGFIDAIVTERDLRGKGIGTTLLNECLRWFEERNCNVILATVDRYNSLSWNLFIRRGFTVYETKDQVEESGGGFSASG